MAMQKQIVKLTELIANKQFLSSAPWMVDLDYTRNFCAFWRKTNESTDAFIHAVNSDLVKTKYTDARVLIAADIEFQFISGEDRIYINTTDMNKVRKFIADFDMIMEYEKSFANLNIMVNKRDKLLGC